MARKAKRRLTRKSGRKSGKPSQKERLRRRRISIALTCYWRKLTKSKRKKIIAKISASMKATHLTGVSAKARRAAVKASSGKRIVVIPRGITKPPSVPSRKIKKWSPSLSMGLPSGYVPSTPAEVALVSIGNCFDGIRSGLPGYNWNTIIHPNSDGSIDGELRLIGIPRGISLASILFQVELLVGKRIPGVWLSVGCRSPFTNPDDECYSWGVHYRGALQTQAYPQRMANMADNFKTARDKIVKGLERKGYRKPDELFIRLHWNPSGASPPREK